MTRILHLDASARSDASLTRQASAVLVDQLASADQAEVTHRDIDEHTQLLNEQMVASYFTAPEQRSSDQKAVIEASDAVVADLKNHDLYVIGLPMYNFAAPAAFKAWADLAARVGETFRYTDQGPIGLLKNKKVVIVTASGGTEFGSDIDFLTPWVRQFFKFLGVENCEIHEADDVLAEQQPNKAAA